MHHEILLHRVGMPTFGYLLQIPPSGNFHPQDDVGNPMGKKFLRTPQIIQTNSVSYVCVCACIGVCIKGSNNSRRYDYSQVIEQVHGGGGVVGPSGSWARRISPTARYP